MSIKATTLKAQKPKTNNFVSILKQFLEKYNLLADSTLEQLREHALELNVQLHNWKARKCVKDLLARRTDKRHTFSKEQIGVLVPDKKKEKLTIGERAFYCTKTGDKQDIYINALDLGPKSNNDKETVAFCSRLSLFCIKLAKAGIAQELIDTYAKDPDVTIASNKIQKERTEQNLVNNQSRTPLYFSLTNVHKRIQNIDVSKIPTHENLTNVIVMLSMKPAKVRSLQISHYKVDPSNPPA